MRYFAIKFVLPTFNETIKTILKERHENQHFHSLHAKMRNLTEGLSVSERPLKLRDEFTVALEALDGEDTFGLGDL